MKYILFTIAFLLASNCLKAQYEQFDRVGGVTGAQGFPQPSISSASTYGKIPVGLFTGTPNISIPLYEFKLKDDINLPVNLNYNVGNVKPNNLPSEVGLGWNFECGGYITRIVKDLPDTYYNTDEYGDYRVITTEKTLVQEATSGVQYPGYAPNAPDEYQFSFLGYSGSFIYNYKTGTWMLQSDADIKIEYKRITYGDSRPQIAGPLAQRYNDLKSDGYIIPNPLQYSFFDTFTLTTPDGYKYIFGGTTNTDYNISFKGFMNNPTPITWHLSKIITPSGHEVEFLYQMMPLQINGNMSFNISVEAMFWETAMSYNYELLAPVQLVEIKDITDNKTLASFHYSPSTQLAYNSQHAWMTAMDDGLVTYYTREKSFRLSQLDYLEIFDKIKIKFSYTQNSAERLKLLTLTKTTPSGTQSTYSMNYNPRMLPPYDSGHYDHLGFNNGKDFSYYFTKNFFNNALDTKKQVAEGNKYTNSRMGDKLGEDVTAEMLKSITYPTKGRTEFTFEPNVISSMVSIDRKTLMSARLPYPNTPNYTYPGGIRIKQIDNYDRSGELLTRKHYYYTEDFTPVNRKGISSGI